MKIDYELIELTNIPSEDMPSLGFEEMSPDLFIVLKCYAKEKDLYRQTTCTIKKEILNTKEFVLLVHEFLNICIAALKKAQTIAP